MLCSQFVSLANQDQKSVKKFLDGNSGSDGVLYLMSSGVSYIGDNNEQGGTNKGYWQRLDKSHDLSGAGIHLIDCFCYGHFQG